MMPLLMAMIIITLLRDAVGDDDDDADPYWRHLRYNASFMVVDFTHILGPRTLASSKVSPISVANLPKIYIGCHDWCSKSMKILTLAIEDLIGVKHQ